MVVKTVVEAQDIFDKAWEGFKGEDWKEKASVSRFGFKLFNPYDGDESFLQVLLSGPLHIKKIVEETKPLRRNSFPNGHSSSIYR